MKQKITLSILAIVCAVFSASAVIQITGYTVWSSTSITDDIEINPGATLVIQNLNVNVLAGKQIHIQDGGRIYGNNGVLTCNDGLWRGIDVDPTPDINPTTIIAVEFLNFELSRAEYAIRSGNALQSTGVHNRKIFLTAVKFNYNDWHLSVENTVNNFSGSTLLAELSQMTHSTVYAYRCDFMETNSGGDDINFTWLYSPKLIECHFLGVPGPIGTCIFWKGCHNGLITRCNFRENRQVYILLDYNGNDYTRIHDNLFNLYNIDIWRAAIFAPVVSGSSYLFKNLSVQGNTFYTSDNNQDDAIGINIGTYWGGSGNNTKYQNLTVANNRFLDIQHGVALAGAFGEDNIIQSNLFSGCRAGCYFREDNLGVTIECNTFELNITDIHISDGAELQNQDLWIDNGNTWSAVGLPNVNILNDGSIMFEYHFNSNLPVVQGPVTLTAVVDDKDCGGGGGGGSSSMTASVPSSVTLNSSDISMSPNPAVDKVSYEIRNVSIDEIVVTSLTGQIVLRVNVQNVSSGQLDVSKFEPGMYICNYINQTGTQHQERLIITN